jgi:transcriptional regulator with XRE-family HTH domain
MTLHTPAQRAEGLKIGERLQWAREGQGMTRMQLAAHLGIHHGMVRNMEQGTRVPSVFLAMSLCHVLGISPQYLLWGILQGCETELQARLRRDHPELTLPDRPVQHSKMPNPGKTGRSVRSNARASSAAA